MLHGSSTRTSARPRVQKVDFSVYLTSDNGRKQVAGIEPSSDIFSLSKIALERPFGSLVVYFYHPSENPSGQYARLSALDYLPLCTLHVHLREVHCFIYY